MVQCLVYSLQPRGNTKLYITFMNRQHGSQSLQNIIFFLVYVLFLNPTLCFHISLVCIFCQHDNNSNDTGGWAGHAMHSPRHSDRKFCNSELRRDRRGGSSGAAGADTAHQAASIWTLVCIDIQRRCSQVSSPCILKDRHWTIGIVS